MPTTISDPVHPDIESHYHDELFFLASRHLATRSVLHFRTNGGASAILFHSAYICPVCGELWLRRVFTPHPVYSRPPPAWQATLVHCEKHGGGLIILPHEVGANFPREICEHDILHFRSS